MKVSFIGGGNMGEAMFTAILGKRLSEPQNIRVSDISEARRQYLQQKYDIIATDNNRAAAEKGDIIILAVKPQHLSQVMAEFSGSIKPGQLVLSIIAGARIKTLRQGLRHRRIIRTMPNTLAQIGEGITVWTATKQVTLKQAKQARSILGAMGKEIHVEDEKYLDMSNAISGSGPAYFFLFVESLIDAGVKIGIPRDTAEKLVLQTMIGATHLVQQSDKSPAELRRAVTSPGGTTAAAISQFETGNFNQLVRQAVIAAYKRARELGS